MEVLKGFVLFGSSDLFLIPNSTIHIPQYEEGPHRLVGQGHRPFTSATGVRIPLGTPKKKRVAEIATLFSSFWLIRLSCGWHPPLVTPLHPPLT